MNRLSVMAAVACLIFVFSLVLIPTSLTQAVTTNIRVVSDSWYVNSSGDFIVVGEVQNTGNFVLESVSLNAVVSASDGSQLASGSTMAYVSDLLPQQKAPFYVDFGNPGSDAISRVSNVAFTVSNAPPTNNKEYTDLSLHIAFKGVLNGVYVVLGSITNNGSQTANDVRVVGTYYNSEGTVVAVGFVILNNPLIPDNSTTFTVSEFDATPSLVASISDYSLLVQTATLQSNSTASTSPTPPTSSPGSSGLIYVFASVVAIVAVATAVLFLVRRRHSLPLPPPPPPPSPVEQEE
jgi:hypothetical protein